MKRPINKEKYPGVYHDPDAKKRAGDLYIRFTKTEIAKYGVKEFYNVTRYDGVATPAKAYKRLQYYRGVMERERRNPFEEPTSYEKRLGDAWQEWALVSYRKDWNSEKGKWLYNSHGYTLQTVFNKWVSPFLGKLKVIDVSRHDIQRVMSEMEKAGVSKRGIRNLYNCLNPFFNHLIDEEIVAVNPVERAFRGWKKEKPTGILEILGGRDLFEVLRELYKGFNEFEHPKGRLYTLENRVFALITLMCGRRQGETAQLEVRDIDLANGWVTVRAEINKTKTFWKYPIPEELKEPLQELVKGKKENERVFSTRKRSSYERALVTRMIRKTDPSLSLNGKQLRKAVATALEELGESAVEIDAYILNHAETGSLAHYIQRDFNKGGEMLGKYWGALRSKNKPVS